jgi:hypothetical protein
MGLSAETFPSFPTYEGEDFFSAEIEILKEMIEKTIFAVSSDESRYNLTGVYFAKVSGEEEKSVRMVATDGYRLSMIERSLKIEDKGLEKGILLPKKGLATRVRHCYRLAIRDHAWRNACSKALKLRPCRLGISRPSLKILLSYTCLRSESTLCYTSRISCALIP